MRIIKENKDIVSDKIKQLFQSSEQEDDKLDHELSKIEKSTIGIETKSLIGKFNLGKAGDEETSLELAKQMVKKLHDEKREHKLKMKELQEQRKELKAKLQTEAEKKKQNDEFQQQQEFEEKKEKIREHIEQRKEKIQKAKQEMIRETK